jgi:hypothetical protein
MGIVWGEFVRISIKIFSSGVLGVLKLPVDGWRRDEYIEKKDRLPPDYPSSIPPLIGYYEDNLRSYLVIPSDQKCADAYYYNYNEADRWLLLELKSKSHFQKALEQLETTLKYLQNRGLPLHAIWISYTGFDINTKNRFTARKKESGSGHYTVLCEKGKRKPFMLGNRYEIFLNQV